MRVHITTHELCQHFDLSTETLVEIVEHGILEREDGYSEDQPEQWSFNTEHLLTLRRASRLHRDLGIDWAGVGLVLDLLDERDRLRHENETLHRRLRRFEP